MFSEDSFQNTQLLVASTPKVLIISSVKVATRYIQKVTDNYSFIFINENFNLIDTPKTPTLELIKEDWDALFDRKLKKDVLVLYRDPYKRLQSAIIQDVVTGIVHPEYKPLLNEYFMANSHTDAEISKFYNRMGNISKLELIAASESDVVDKDKTTLSMLGEVLKLYIGFYLKNNKFNFYHNKIYLPYLVGLLLNNKLDKNKLRFLNIDDKDESLEDVLFEYDLSLEGLTKQEKKQSKFSNKKFIDTLLSDVISDAGGEEALRHRIAAEIIAYNQIENHHKIFN